jgi:hypothetical protein
VFRGWGPARSLRPTRVWSPVPSRRDDSIVLVEESSVGIAGRRVGPIDGRCRSFRGRERCVDVGEVKAHVGYPRASHDVARGASLRG